VILQAGTHRLKLGARPLLMGILNATPDSFSEERGEEALAVRVARGRALIAAGADLLDIGGESARGDRPAVGVQEEIDRVCGLIEALAGEALISVDTYKPEVAEAAIAAGAAIVNDVSGLRDPRLAEVCAATGAGLVLMHTAVAPKGTLLDPGTYADVAEEVVEFLTERMAVARSMGVTDAQLVLDPGPDFAKTPAQTVAVLRRLDAIAALGRPILLAASRKDFVGAITGKRPPERDPGTLAALAHGVEHGASILRVHDVAGARDYFEVRAVLTGERVLGPLEGLSPERYPDGVPPHLTLG
jgi:dihydropteroate synthase